MKLKDFVENRLNNQSMPFTELTERRMIAVGEFSAFCGMFSEEDRQWLISINEPSLIDMDHDIDEDTPYSD